MAILLHRNDGTHQVASVVCETLRQERLVEVRVWLYERRQQQVPRQIEHVLVGLCRQGCSHLVDGVEADTNIDNAPVGKRGRSKQHG